MSKIVIIEPNTDDKDQIKAYLVKGERGYSAYELYVQEGGTLTEEEWLDAFLNAENYYTKSESDDLLDDKIDTDDIVDDLTSTDATKVLSAKQGKALNDKFSNYMLNSNIAVLSGTTSSISGNGYVYFQENYPNEFTKDNCVVISQMCEPNYESAVLQSGEVLSASVDEATETQVNPRVRFADSKIWIHVFNRTGTAKTFNYKIVLMKIS